MIALDTDNLLCCPECGAQSYVITGWQAPPHQLLWIECAACGANLSAQFSSVPATLRQAQGQKPLARGSTPVLKPTNE
jgi:transcription elongation factor Elf1